ncbi:MAG: GxGYxYP domain-containing protein, partial [Barnesiella intestinihominis]
MMKSVLIYGVLFWVLGCYKAAGQEAIGLYDLHYTLETDLSTPKGRNFAWDDVHVVSALQGIVNRDAPQLYVFFVDRDQLDIDKYWLNKYRRKGQWLYRKETVTYNTIEDLVSAYAGYIKGVVLYDERVPSTSNVASAVAGAEDLLPIRYDLDSESLYSRLVLGGPRLKVKRRLINEDGSVMFTGSGVIPGTNRNSTGSIKNDPYIWYIENYMKTGKCNTEYAAYYLDQYWKQNPGATVRNHHTLSNHDFFISKRAFFFDLSPWGDEPATDEPTQKVGTDLATLKEMLLLAYQQNKGEKYCYIGGFPSWAFKYTKHAGGIHDDVPTEWEFLRLISAYNAFKDADAIAIGALANASFWQHFPLEERYSQPWVTHEELKQRGLLTEDGKVDVKGRNFLIFYVGDYDASSWVSQFTSLTWDDPNRGKVPMMWAISPVLQERVPHVLHNFRKTATKNDYFVASDNGAGYLSPGMLQEPRPISGLPSGLQSWAEHCKPYYEKWGLSITGFIVDGYAPGLNWEGMECYRSFSPNGIVPQKLSSWSMLFGNMPVLRADYDINDVEPKDAAVAIVNRIREREGLPFHWFRNIIKSPTWYVEVVEELKKIDDSICLLDAPSFFELLRIYLKETAPFAGGTGSR